MTGAKFDAGQRVSINRSATFQAPGVYRVVNVMPPNRGQQQYRIRSEDENFDRVMDENRLEAAASND